MLKQRTDETVAIRAYRAADEAAVLALLDASLGGGPAGRRTAEFFRWKHVENPAGTSLMLVAEVDGRIVGLRAFMRWRLWTRAGDVRAVVAVDTATHPDHQGRGIFSRLTLEALDLLRGEADVVFNTPNEKSLPGYLKMGWRVVGTVPVHVRIRRPLRVVTRASGLRGETGAEHLRPASDASPAAELFADEGRVSSLLATQPSPGSRLRTVRDLAYLRWRYTSVPHLDYRVVDESDHEGLAGFAVFRIRPRRSLWECTVTDVLVRPGAVATARRLLRAAATSAGVDVSTCHFSNDTIGLRAARRTGFIRAPFGIILAARPLRDGLEPDPTDPASWDLTLGDLEVF